MAFQLVSALQVSIEAESRNSKVSRIAMRKLDRAAEALGIRWTKALAIAGEVVGKTKHLSISEADKVIARLKELA